MSSSEINTDFNYPRFNVNILAPVSAGEGPGGCGWRRQQADGRQQPAADHVPPSGGVHVIGRGSRLLCDHLSQRIGRQCPQ